MRALSLVAAAALPAAIAGYSLSEVESRIASFSGQQQSASPSEHPTSLPGCYVACQFLHFALPNAAALPGSAAYKDHSEYWSAQQSTAHPACRLLPSSAADVSLTVLTSRVTKCPFAVKSGGHVPFEGSSNIDGGITVDLAQLKEVTVSADKTEVAIGAGNVWYDVYAHLEPYKLKVIGGRVSAVGVGGLTLGGGISFFSNKHGWACDNINTYEVVFADGSVRNVTYDSEYKDLYWALRGGGNNFGVVTRFHAAAYPLDDMWGGSRVVDLTPDSLSSLSTALADFTERSNEDPKAQVIMALGYAQSLNRYLAVTDLQYSEPQAYPAILANLTAVQPELANTLRITNLPDLTQELNMSNPNGLRQTFRTAMVQNDATLIKDIFTIFQKQIDPVANATSLVPALVFQPMSTDVFKHFNKNGGNPLGLENNKTPLLLVLTSVSWGDEADDERIMAATRATISEASELANSRGLGSPYIYQNYAAKDQDVFGGYGKENHDRLRAISKKYDPTGVFQKLQPGYFKL